MNRLLILTYNVRRSLFQLGINTFYKPHQLTFKNTKFAILPVVNNLGDNI